MLGRLRFARGDLKICQASPLVEKVLRLTNLLDVFHLYASAKEAIEAFSQPGRFAEPPFTDDGPSGEAIRPSCTGTLYTLPRAAPQRQPKKPRN